MILLGTDVLIDFALDRQPHAAAASLPMKDFEGALQVAAAHSAGAGHIVTRNIKDYARSPIPAMLPATAARSLRRRNSRKRKFDIAAPLADRLRRILAYIQRNRSAKGADGSGFAAVNFYGAGS